MKYYIKKADRLPGVRKPKTGIKRSGSAYTKYKSK